MGHPVVQLILEGEPYWKFYSNTEGQFIKSFIQVFEIIIQNERFLSKVPPTTFRLNEN